MNLESDRLFQLSLCLLCTTFLATSVFAISGGKPMAPRGNGLNYGALHNSVKDSQYRPAPTPKVVNTGVGRSVDRVMKGGSVVSVFNPVLDYARLRKSVEEAAKSPNRQPVGGSPYKMYQEKWSSPKWKQNAQKFPDRKFPTNQSSFPKKVQ